MAAARPERRYVRLMDAPDVWGLSTDTIYRARARGELHIYKPVGVALLKVSEVDAWVESRTGNDGPDVGSPR